MIVCASAIIGFLIYFAYKPTYSVTLDGKFIGYTEDKRKLQDKINEYIKTGDNNIIAFVEIDTLPEYKMCLLKKGITTNSDEIFDEVISSGVPYYKYYAVSEKNEEKYYVSTYEEAEEIINELKEKDSNNTNDVTYSLKYSTELKTFTDTETAVAALYVEKPKVVTTQKTSTSSFNTSANVNYSYAALGIDIIKPINGTISSRFGSRSSIRSSVHTGLDIAASTGTPIKAVAGGTVIFSGKKGSYGFMVVIDHGNGVETYYAHCSSLNVSAGETVSQGQVIANVGSTGNSTGPHLHLEIRLNGVALNPQNYLYN
jgi:murein DD-endopeptidase MepM/ murein hydrolase activator NlpD